MTQRGTCFYSLQRLSLVFSLSSPLLLAGHLEASTSPTHSNIAARGSKRPTPPRPLQLPLMPFWMNRGGPCRCQPARNPHPASTGGRRPQTSLLGPSCLGPGLRPWGQPQPARQGCANPTSHCMRNLGAACCRHPCTRRRSRGVAGDSWRRMPSGGRRAGRQAGVSCLARPLWPAPSCSLYAICFSWRRQIY